MLVIERLEPIGADRILALLRVSATGRASGITAGADVLGGTGRDSHTATISDVADGKIRRIRVFLDRQEAFEAASCGSRRCSQETSPIWRGSRRASGPSCPAA
jgi:hypothetical protein